MYTKCKRPSFFSINKKGEDLGFANGPVSLLIQSLNEMGATINEDFIVTQDKEDDIDLRHIPIQHIKPIFYNARANARTRTSKGTRVEHVGLDEIDRKATNSLLNNIRRR